MNDEAKAVKAIADTTGKAIDAARDAGAFIVELIREPLRERFGIWTDNLKARRMENQLALAKRLKEKAAELGSDIEWQSIPMRIGVPLLEAASLAEEVDLQEKWTNLILNYGNARSGVSAEKSFVSILGELGPLEAAILDAIYSMPSSPNSKFGIRTEKLPVAAERDSPERLDPSPAGEPTPEIALALGNLLRMGCIRAGTGWGDGGEILAVVFETNLGRELVKACTLQKPAA